jgi:hypothetical protein
MIERKKEDTTAKMVSNSNGNLMEDSRKIDDLETKIQQLE